MIDYSNEIFNLISKELKNQFDTIKVIGENISIPTDENGKEIKSDKYL